jgi:hypothetical protein
MVSNASGSSSPQSPQKFTPDDVLPHVEPPNVTFLLQLFFIPLVIVSIIVGVWLLFSWLASESVDPQQMLKEIRSNKEASWQRAVTMASMLDSPDPQFAELRKDPKFAAELGDILVDELKTPLSNRESDKQRLQVRYYLSRALGRLETPAAIAPLLHAAQLQREGAEVDVRLGAMESLAVLAKALGPETLREHPRALEVLLEASRASDSSGMPAEGQSPDYRPHGEVRGAAAYALGVIGGPTATERLVQMLDDVYPNARYNAATGLARQGDERAIPVLVEMLEPHNDLVAKEERGVEERDDRRIKVIKNGIQASTVLAEAKPSANLEPLRKALAALASPDAKYGVKSPAARTSLTGMAKVALRKLDGKS